MTLLEEIAAKLGAMPEAEKKAVIADAVAATADLRWVPNPGPQTDAYFCEADELFYGGSAGGGKSDLLIGLSLTQHHDSLILRRTASDAKDLAKRGRAIAGPGHGFNGTERIIRQDGRQVWFGGCPNEDDKEKFKGRAKDFYGFDEIADFTESQFRFIKNWNRSTLPDQRCRVVCTGNPATRPEGLWINKYWAPWLDPRHPNPAKPGELRWFIRGEDDRDQEVEGPGQYTVGGVVVRARSRTFIQARLDDNPDLKKTDYGAALDSLPAELRASYRDGNFQAALKDEPWQLFPASWVLDAMQRWRPDGWKTFNMTALACDAAGGGADAAEIAFRHGDWFGPIETEKGPQTEDGNFMAGRIVAVRRHDCTVIVDCSGGYGGSYCLRLSDNRIVAIKYKGGNTSFAKTKDRAGLGFLNKRAETYWRLREALDPSQEGGSSIALPPDDELKADLLATHYEVRGNIIRVEPKEDIKKRIGRSPGKGDAVAMCHSEGDAAVRRSLFGGRGGPGLQTQANVGYAHMKKRR